MSAGVPSDENARGAGGRDRSTVIDSVAGVPENARGAGTGARRVRGDHTIAASRFATGFVAAIRSWRLRTCGLRERRAITASQAAAAADIVVQ